jgi:hypothetical protein
MVAVIKPGVALKLASIKRCVLLNECVVNPGAIRLTVAMVADVLIGTTSAYVAAAGAASIVGRAPRNR